MALTEITNIANFQFSRNPMVAEIGTNADVITAGTFCVLSIKPGTGSGANTIGGTITLQWIGGLVVFTVVTTPDDTGTQVRAKGSNTDAAYAIMLVEDFSKNYDLYENFVIQVASTVNVSFFSKKKYPKVTDYDLSASFNSVNFGMVVDTGATAVGTNEVLAENYKMRADLMMSAENGSTNFTKRGTVELDALNHACVFYFEEMADANLEYDLPTYNLLLVTSCKYVIKQFYLNYLEKYGVPMVNYRMRTTAIGHVIKAGIDKEKWDYATPSILKDIYASPASRILRWLTRQPKTKYIREMDQEFIYLCIWHSTSAWISTQVVSLDGLANATLSYTWSPSITMETICIPSGFNAMGLGSPHCAWDNLKYYEISVKTSAGDQSEKFRFYPDRDIWRDNTVFLFSNSLGGVDTLRCTGVKETGLGIEKETIDRTRVYNEGVVPGESVEIGHQKSRPMKVNTGWLTKEQVDWLEDFFMAEQKMVDMDGKFLPIVISSNVFKKYDSILRKTSLEFEWRVAFKNKA